MKASAHGLIIYQGKLLMLLRDNIPTIPNPNTWSLIGGVIEEGETPEQAFVRETEEESGIKLKNYKYLMPKFNGNGHLFLAILNDADVATMKLGSEGQELKFFTVDEMDTLNLGGENLNQLYKQNRELLKSFLASTL